MVRFLRIDTMVNGSNAPSPKLDSGEESRQLSVILGVGIMRCGHIERKDLETDQLVKSSLSKNLKFEFEFECEA